MSNNQRPSEFDEVDPGAGAGTRTPCIVVADTSGSMGKTMESDKPTPIEQLNQGLEAFQEALYDDEVARMSVEVSIISFGGEVKTETDFVLADEFSAPKLKAGGRTPMCEAMLDALELVETRKNFYKSQGVDYRRPWIWLMTDGYPTDEDEYLDEATRRVNEAVQDNKVTIFVVGTSTADFDRLQQFSPERSPMKLLGANYRDMFEWLSNSLSTTSQNAPGDQAALEAPGWGTAPT